VAPATSPKEPVLRLWCDLEQGDVAAAAETYDARVRQVLGKTLPETLKIVRRSGIYRRTAVVDVQPAKLVAPAVIAHIGTLRGTLVTAGYRLAPRGSGWAITWDTTLRFWLGAYLNGRVGGRARGAVSRRVLPHAEVAVAVRRYDQLFRSPFRR